MDNGFAVRLIIAGIDSGHIILYPGERLELIPDDCFIGLSQIQGLEERNGIATDGLTIKAYKDLDDLVSEPVNVVYNDPVVQQEEKDPDAGIEKEKEKKKKRKKKVAKKKEIKEIKEKEREASEATQGTEKELSTTIVLKEEIINKNNARRGVKVRLPLAFASLTLEEMRARPELMDPYLLVNPHRSMGEAFSEFDDFRNYHEKHGTVYVNWVATWRSWIKKSIEIAKKNALRDGCRAPLNFITAPAEWK